MISGQDPVVSQLRYEAQSLSAHYFRNLMDYAGSLSSSAPPNPLYMGEPLQGMRSLYGNLRDKGLSPERTTDAMQARLLRLVARKGAPDFLSAYRSHDSLSDTVQENIVAFPAERTNAYALPSSLRKIA